MSKIAAGATLGDALVLEGDTTNTLVFETNGVSGMTIDSNQDVTFFGDVTFSGATTFNDLVVGDELTIVGQTHIRETSEYVNIVTATGAATINFDWNDGGVTFITATGATDFTLNIRGASGVTLNSVLATGEAAGFCLLFTQGGTAYNQTALTIDGAAATVNWQGGSTGVASVNGIDAFAGTIIKTGSGTFTVLESVTPYSP